MKFNKLSAAKIKLLFLISTCILLFNSPVNAQLFGSIQNVVPQPDGSLIVNGWACNPEKRSSVRVDFYSGVRGTTGAKLIAHGEDGIVNPPGTISECMNSISGYSYKISSENVLLHSEKKLWGYVKVGRISTHMSGSGSFTIGQIQQTSKNRQNQPSSSFSLSQLQGLNSSNTGPQVNLDNLVLSGLVTTTNPGEVIEGLSINGGVIISQNDVTLRNCRVKGLVFIKPGVSGTKIKNCSIDANFWYWGIRVNGNNTLIENVEIKNATTAGIGIDVSPSFSIVQANKIHIKRVNIHDSSDGIQSRPGNNSDYVVRNLLVEESYFHDSLTRKKAEEILADLPADITKKAVKTLDKIVSRELTPHNDGIQLAGNINVIIRNNRISIPSDESVSLPNAPIFVGPDIFSDENIIVVDNLVSGGSSPLKVNKNKPIKNVLFSNNYLVQGKWIHKPINVAGTNGHLDCMVVNNIKNTLGEELLPYALYEESSYNDSIVDDSCFVGPSGWSNWPSNWPVD